VLQVTSGIAAALRNAPFLSREDEQDLARRWRTSRDEAALHRLVLAYGRLVFSMARRFRRFRLPFEDLVQEGVIGLLHAADRFEPERNLRFSTYAMWWIRCAMQDYVLRNWSIVRVSSTPTQKLLFFRLVGRRDELGDGHVSGEITDESCVRIGAACGAKPALVRMIAVKLMRHDASLNASVTSDGESAMQDLLVDEGPSPEDLAAESRAAATRRRVLADALETLDPRERDIVLARRLQEDAATLEELGEKYGVTKERIRQVEQRAMRKMREAILQHVGDGADLFATA
jgi:RNA polymerase sigma-32 factor